MWVTIDSIFVAQTDLLGEHDGQEYEFKIARLFDFDRYYVMPQLDVTYQSASLVDHYFGVNSGGGNPWPAGVLARRCNHRGRQPRVELEVASTLVCNGQSRCRLVAL